MSNTALFRALCVKGGTHPDKPGVFTTVSFRYRKNSVKNLIEFYADIVPIHRRHLERTRAARNDATSNPSSGKYLYDIVSIFNRYLNNFIKISI